MGIMAPIARMILQEHKYRPITGKGMLIGRQTMPFSVQAAVEMLKQEGINLQSGIDLESISMIDHTTRLKGENQISDVAFFSLFSSANFVAVDVTDYEGADIVHDMCTPVPSEMEGTVDFLWTGSCMDNMFDPATCLRNTVKLLKPGGRAVLMEIGTPQHNAYTMYSPAYFFDYFALNNFSDCKVYMCTFPSVDILTAQYDLFTWKSFESTIYPFPMHQMGKDTCLLTCAIVEKGNDSTWDRNPVQGQYRPSHEAYETAYSRFKSSNRPVVRRHFEHEALQRYPEFFGARQPHHEYLGTMESF